MRTILVALCVLALLGFCSWAGYSVVNRFFSTQELTTVPVNPPVQQLTPVVVQQNVQLSDAPAQLLCPTTADAKVATGVDVQRLATEACAFVWRAVDQATTIAICPSGWVCTWDVPGDVVVVHLGVNQTTIIRAGTWRFIDGYPSNDAVHDVCALYEKEKNFGLIEVPSFQVRFQSVSDGTYGPVGPQSCQ